MKKQFTLLELLIVISIMVILMSLLLPSLRKARETAKGIVCISNEKQCAIAQLAYAGDFNGFAMVYSGTNDKPWHMYLYESKYISTYEPTLCPSWSPFKYDSTRSGIKHLSYGMVTYWTSSSFFLKVTDTFSYRALIVNKVSSPSDYFFINDSLSMSATASSGTIYQQQIYEFPVNTTGTGRLHTRHGKERANIAYLDGHAESSDDSRIVSAARKINGDSSPVTVFKKSTIEVQLYP